MTISNSEILAPASIVRQYFVNIEKKQSSCLGTENILRLVYESGC
jgi:hypothetical protein